MSRGLLPVKIVALGDSLTTGFQSCGLSERGYGCTPYTETLAEQIGGNFSSSRLSVEIVNKGTVGELTEQMLARFESDVVAMSPRIVIILGGSNDLGWGLSPSEVFSNLSHMYELSLKNGITPIACTVPSILGFDWGIPPRLELNNMIQECCSRAKVRCVDLFTATEDPTTRRLDPRYSSDGLHLNTDGYRQIGIAVYKEGVAPALRELMNLDR